MTRRGNLPAERASSARGLLGGVLLVGGLAIALYAWRSGPSSEAPSSAADVSTAAPSSASTVPPFHADADSARPFPALLDPGRFEIPVVARAYEIAHEMPEVLAQQPCYCNCGVFGHGSLLDCFASEHGAT